MRGIADFLFYIGGGIAPSPPNPVYNPILINFEILKMCSFILSINDRFVFDSVLTRHLYNYCLLGFVFTKRVGGGAIAFD